MTTALIIEDNENNHELICFPLEQSGYKTRYTMRGLVGAQQTISNPPNFAILDIQSAYTNGLKVLRNIGLYPAGKQVPIIAMTSYVMSGDSGKLLAAGCAANI